MILETALTAVLLLAAPKIGEVELASRDQTSFTVTFVTKEPRLAKIFYGLAPGDLELSARETGGPTRFHYVKVTGLSPAQWYNFRVQVEDTIEPPAWKPPLAAGTLAPPPGEHVFSFAVINDLHVGEDVAGLITLPIPGLPPLTPGFDWDKTGEEYWEFCLRASVDAINKTAAELVVVNGDLSAEYREQEFVKARSMLSKLRVPFYPIRGNHDRVGERDEDYFLKVFKLDRSWRSFDHRGFHFILLDDTRLEDGFHAFPEEEFKWLERDLAMSSDKPTFLFCHRPIGAGWADVKRDIRKKLLNMIAQSPQVVAVFNGHSHRARLTELDLGGRTVPFIEVPANKEYPLGWGLVSVSSAGFSYVFQPTDCPECNEWRSVTRGEYFGRAPHLNFGEITDRSAVFEFSEEARMLLAP